LTPLCNEIVTGCFRIVTSLKHPCYVGVVNEDAVGEPMDINVVEVFL